jgi:hypothetical protein
VRLAKALEAKGFDVSYSGKLLQQGSSWEAQLRSQLKHADALILYVSPRYLESDWSRFEAGAAVGRTIAEPNARLVPVVMPDLKPRDLPQEFRQYQSVRARGAQPNEIADQVVAILAADKST